MAQPVSSSHVVVAVCRFSLALSDPFPPSSSLPCSALESDLAPVLIVATNRGIARIRGTEYKSPHGIPLDLLDRMMIISTKPYNDKELKSILTLRAEDEDVEMTAAALDLLTRIARESSLRYAMHMIMTASLCAKSRKADEVDVQDVRRVFGLFSDLKRSMRYLLDHNKEFMFNEADDDDDEEEAATAAADSGKAMRD
jgi:RuvB-like protein 2